MFHLDLETSKFDYPLCIIRIRFMGCFPFPLWWDLLLEIQKQLLQLLNNDVRASLAKQQHTGIYVNAN